MPRFRVTPFVWEGVPCVAAGTGYTGEDGVELAVPADGAEALWKALLAAGVQPAGLGARDTLRLEAALPLHGHELGPGHHPAAGRAGLGGGLGQAGLPGPLRPGGRAGAGVARRLVGLATEGRQPPREGAAVLEDGRPAGTVTSGNFSPMLGHGIALAFVDSAFEPAPGLAFEIEQRGRSVPATVVATPFTRPGQWANEA